MIYVILGMHKSGTTLISQILHHSGINMVDDAKAHVSYEQGNQYERESTQAINQAMLSSEGAFSLDIAPPKKLEVTPTQRARMQEIIQNCNEKYTDWGFKDPSTCLVYPAWASVLPKYKIIAIYRSPSEVWQRYRSKSIRRSYRVPDAAWTFVRRWCDYNANILTCLQSTKMDFLVLNYQSLMTTQTEFDRLQEFVGIKLDDMRDMSLYHYQPRKLVLLDTAAWLVHKQTGHHPGEIIKQLEALR